jgi:dephospho-CoA kinase
MVLVSGVPATGKTTFAEWLSSEICAPLVSRDRVIEKYVEIAGENLDEEQKRVISHSIPAVLFWFFCEEIMKSSSPLIIEAGFTNQMKESINGLIEKYKYQTINVHFDAPVEITHRRFHERSARAKEIPLEIFKKALEQDGKVKEAYNFRYGDCIINVDTTDFSTVSYNDIAEQIRMYST